MTEIFNPHIHRRRSIRLRGYNYRQTGAYFITICTWNRECMFGEMINGGFHESTAGRIVRQTWMEIPKHFPHAELDSFVVMPNHIHGIIVIRDLEELNRIREYITASPSNWDEDKENPEYLQD